jgi:hypothetical protein
LTFGLIVLLYMIRFYITLCIFLVITISAQKDSVLAKIDSSFTKGIYLKYSDFRCNRPIPVDSITCKKNNEATDIYTKLKNNNHITYTKNGKAVKIPVGAIWGYMENKKLYVYFEGKFEPVNYPGAICNFWALTYHKEPHLTFNSYKGVMVNKAFQPFIMSFYNGKIAYASYDELCKLLKPDAVLYEEYKSLDKEKRSEQLKQYIIKYNKTHPIYILK